MAALCICSFAAVGTRFLSFMRTLILWLAFLVMLLIWSLKFRLQSIDTPNRGSLSVSSISFPWIFKDRVSCYFVVIMHQHGLVFGKVSFQPIDFVPSRCLFCITRKWWLDFRTILSYFVQMVVVCVHGDIRFNFVGEVILEDVPYIMEGDLGQILGGIPCSQCAS